MQIAMLYPVICLYRPIVTRSARQKKGINNCVGGGNELYYVSAKVKMGGTEEYPPNKS